MGSEEGLQDRGHRSRAISLSSQERRKNVRLDWMCVMEKVTHVLRDEDPGCAHGHEGSGMSLSFQLFTAL